MEGYKNRPGYRRISVNMPADLVVRIDLLAATRPDHPYRAEVVTEAIRVYLSQQVDQLSKLAPLLESSEDHRSPRSPSVEPAIPPAQTLEDERNMSTHLEQAASSVSSRV